MKSSMEPVYFAVLIGIVSKTVLSSGEPLSSFSENRPIVEVQEGKLRGIREKNINGTGYFFAFRGIPYAKPPDGDLRFKEPEPIEAWHGIKDAKFFGNSCAQFHWGLKHLEGSDDCLYLNVYTKDLNPDEPNAVMVLLHGGCFYWCSGDDNLFGPDFLVEENVVLVTLNYRLSIFGFLNLDNEEASGNQGLKDQIMALKWVKRNIAKFGGDPNRVTVFGQSAGAASVHFLSLTPAAQGLFHRGILQSGVATVPWATSSQSMRFAAARVARNLGSNATSTKELIEFLRSVDAIKLAEAVHTTFNPQYYFNLEKPFVPSVDSKSKNPILLTPISEAAKVGIKIPTIIGFNRQEAIFVLAEIKDDDYKFLDMVMLFSNGKKFLQEHEVSVSDMIKFYMGDKKFNRENAGIIMDLLQAFVQTVNIDDFIKIQSTKVPNVPVYVYRFDHWSKETAMVQKFFHSNLEGTAHAEEIPYLFHSKIFTKFGIEQPISYPSERIVQKRMLELWTNFAKTGNPNLPKSEFISVDWKPVDNITEYNCLLISDNLTLVQEPNILSQLQTFAQRNR